FPCLVIAERDDIWANFFDVFEVSRFIADNSFIYKSVRSDKFAAFTLRAPRLLSFYPFDVLVRRDRNDEVWFRHQPIRQAQGKRPSLLEKVLMSRMHHVERAEDHYATLGHIVLAIFISKPYTLPVSIRKRTRTASVPKGPFSFLGYRLSLRVPPDHRGLQN